MDQAMTETKRGIKRKVIQFTKQDKFVRVWDSLTEATKGVTNGEVTQTVCINKACRGQIKTAYGFKWKYLEDYDGEEVRVIKEEIQKEKLKALGLYEEDPVVEKVEEIKKKSDDNFRVSLLEQYVNKKEVFKVLDYAEQRKSVPHYVVLRHCDIDWRHYNRAKYGYTDLTDQEVEKILEYIKKYFGIK